MPGDGEQTHLEGSELSDAGIAALRALGELEELTLGNTRMPARSPISASRARAGG